MRPPLILQVEEAKAAYFAAMRKAPRSTRAVKLLYRLNELRLKQLKQEIRQERAA